jgi:hypothetical protein
MMARFLPRLSVRGLIAAVVLAALVWPATTAMIWLEYRRRVIHHEQICEVLASEIDVLTRQSDEMRGDPFKAFLDLDIEKRRIALADASLQALKYRQAMRRPWRSVFEGPSPTE